MLPGLEERLLFEIQKSWRSLLTPSAVLLSLSKSEPGKTKSLRKMKEQAQQGRQGSPISGLQQWETTDALGSVKGQGKDIMLFPLNSLLVLKEGCHGTGVI